MDQLVHLDKFRRQLEGRTLEAQILGGAREDVAIVDVDDMALVVQQDVPIVTVFYLQSFFLN